MPTKRENWGGFRDGAGRKPKWNSGKTTAIRIPEIFSSDLLQLARHWDEGNSLSPQFTSSPLPQTASTPQPPVGNQPQFEIVQSQLGQRIEELEREKEQLLAELHLEQNRAKELDEKLSQAIENDNNFHTEVERLNRENSQLKAELQQQLTRAKLLSTNLEVAKVAANNLQYDIRQLKAEKQNLQQQLLDVKRSKDIANTDIQRVLNSLNYYTTPKKEKGGYEANNATALKHAVKGVLPLLRQVLKL
ncbi:MAG TPA: hypothetical protein V6D12_18265, partial [Candidatus Obscuribacterales bacterium]